ncbi:hypothetical protein GJAV_G00118440 [Gymnothorax javanicus]|nr:hypothetical protein GJAV_G00118440 [Gymnothorax javanicus]
MNWQFVALKSILLQIFWCQLQSKLSELEKLMEEIQYYYETHVVPWQPTEPCCIVKCPYDGKWYRGCILSAQDGEFDVILVDSGMIVTEKTHNLRAIKAEFLELEGQAFRCCLYDIKPRNSSSGVWHTNACKVLMQFVEVNSQNLKCTVYTQLVVNQKNLYNVVDLHTPYGTATNLLISAGLAREVQSPKQLTPSLYPYSFTYSLFNVNVGCKEQLYVTHVCSPWEIYCQLDKIGQTLEDLMKEVQKTANEMQSLPAAQGRLCLAKYFMDGQWYRGLAYPVQSSLHLNVFFVDYGNMQVVEKCNVRPIPRHATDLLFAPMLALKCCLSGVPKGEVLADVNGWLEKAVLNKLMEAKFVGKDDQGTLFFDLFDGSLHINQKVKDMIALHCQAGKASVEKQNENFLKTVVKTGEGAKAPQCVGRSNGDNSVKAKNMALAHRSRLTTQRASVASMKSSKLLKLKSANSPQEGELHACHYRKRGIVHAHMKSRERSAVQNHKNKEECGHLKPMRSSNLLLNGSHLPETKVKPGFKGIGFVSHVSTATNFYIQMEDDEQAILKMGEDLNEAGLKETMENVSGKLHAGDVIACEYEDDGAFYRAVAIDVSDVKIKVEFIDYGNEATVDIKSARILPRFFFAQPRLSIPCFVEKPHTFLSDASFVLAVDGKRLEVEFIRQCGQQWAVRMEICGVSTSLHNTVEFSRSQEDTNPLETKGELVPKDITKGEKEGHRWCSDSLGIQMKDMPSTASERSKPCMEREMSQNFLHRETAKAFPEVTSQSSAAVKNVSCALLLTKQKKCCRPMKSNMHATGKKQHVRKSAGRKCEINSDKLLLRPFHHPGDEKNQGSRESLEPFVSCSSIVHTPPERTCESSEGQTKHVSIPLQNITAGQTEDGELLSFSENGHFYFRLNRNSKELALLDTLIAEKALKASTISKINIKEGLECLVKSSRNKQWYRAKVQNVTEGQCSVVLLDHGTVEVVPLEAILELSTELREIPKQAVLCQWKGPGCPIEGGFEVLKETLNPSSEQNIRLIFLLYSEFSQIWDIEILINGIHLLQQLRNTSCLKHSENNGTCSTCPHCPVVDTCPVHEISFAQRLSLAPVELDLGYTGFAAAVTAPCEFSVVLEGMLLIMSSVATILETSQEDFDSLPEALIVPGMGCLVKCEKKKKWCRAEIVHVDSTSVVINLVDYGHCIGLPYPCHSQLKRLPEELVRLPKVTYPCILRGVKPASMEIWTDEAVVFFQEHICQKKPCYLLQAVCF